LLCLCSGGVHLMTHVHLIGIGGSGMSAIARLLLESGYTVSGSDRTLSPLAEGLRAVGARVLPGHQASYIDGSDLVVRSSAIPDDNPEVIAARSAGIPVLKRAEFLGQLMTKHFGIAVAGTHGKTTTTAMIAWTLTSLGQDPSYIVGGMVKNLGTNAHAGKGATFVVEADEYDHMFLGLKPRLIIITNVEHDHPDCYPTPSDYRQAFLDFANRLLPGGILFVCSEDEGAMSILESYQPKGRVVAPYGTRQDLPGYQARNLKANARGSFDFEAWICPEKASPSLLARVSLLVPGRHNVLNALAALACAHSLGLSPESAAEALGNYRGTGRRFELRGEVDGIAVIDDYAHHPTQIKATLAAARARYPGRRIWSVWQPHTFSRTRALLPDFAAAFENADQVVVTEVYAAREAPDGFSAASVVAIMPHPAARFIASLPDVTTYLMQELRPGDVLLVLSAGDADLVSTQVLKRLEERIGKHD
jgi:UDP-N-acetylmuramate--alanine ligase